MINQGCIVRSILPSGMGARGVSLEHVENMKMFSCPPTKVRSDSQKTALWFLDSVDVQIKIFFACLFMGSQQQSFFFQTLLFTTFLVTV